MNNMYTNYAVIQKIDTDANLKVFQAEKENLNWTFEHRRKASSSEYKETFPFVIDKSVNLIERRPGAETSIYKLKNSDIRFQDDYCVPSGFVICILGPKGYLPSMIKFREKTAIPLGLPNYHMINPGYIQLYSNRFTKQSGIILMTTQNTFFSIEIDFSLKLNEYPSNINIGYSDTFEASINLVDGKRTYITQSDIQTVCKGYENIHNMDDLVDAINEIIDLMKKDSMRMDEKKFKSAKDRIGSIIQDAIGSGSSIVTIIDSVSNKGFAYNIIKTIFNYFTN